MFSPLNNKRVGDLNYLTLFKKRISKMKGMKNWMWIYKELIVQNRYREREIGIPCTEPSAKYRGVRYFGISLHH